MLPIKDLKRMIRAKEESIHSLNLPDKIKLIIGNSSKLIKSIKIDHYVDSSINESEHSSYRLSRVVYDEICYVELRTDYRSGMEHYKIGTRSKNDTIFRASHYDYVEQVVLVRGENGIRIERYEDGDWLNTVNRLVTFSKMTEEEFEEYIALERYAEDLGIEIEV